MTWDQATTAAELVRALVIPIIGYVAWTVRDIRNELRRINGRVGRMEEWRVNHEKALDDRFHGLDQRLSRSEDRDWNQTPKT